ncbi:MAG: arsR [Candidatus Saccharibacteria bacterium]|nr:arsR [Candidatus Saccharibacteria bacterium]
MPTAPEVFQALADPTRWAIVRHLADGPRCVCELNGIVGLPQSTLSTQLQVLRSAGVLVGERRGRWMYYGISRDSLPFLRAAWKHFPATALEKSAIASVLPDKTSAAPPDCCPPAAPTATAAASRRPLKTKTPP